MPRGDANQLVDTRGSVLELGHVDANHLLVVAEQELGQRLGQLCLADAGRPEEQQHAIGAIEAVLERPLVEDQAARQGANRLALPDHAFAELRLEIA